jgi:hypothetical protein
MKSLLFVLPILLLTTLFTRGDEIDGVSIDPINVPCATQSSCMARDAVFFVHGIYGDKDTFKNGTFDWPNEFAKQFDNKVDVYVITYPTKLISWLKKDIASFEDISDNIFALLQGKPIPGGGRMRDGLLSDRPYRSVGFMAHSLGGNVAAAYIHSVKSELGHEARAQNSFLITLGTPADGAQIANVAVVAKSILAIRDPLLQSLGRDNTFLRMLASWRNAENVKANHFDCRPVNLYVGVEGSPMLGMTIVSKESAEEPYRNIAKEVKVFEGYNHSQIAKPADANDPVFVWVRDIVKGEQERLNTWSGKLCRASC